MAEGTVWLVPVWLGDAGGVEQLPPENLAVVERVPLVFAEDERTARRMLRRMSPTLDLPAREVHRLDKDTDAATIETYARMTAGREALLLSEAGMPAIADPGARLVAAAHRLGLRVVPLVGPSSLLLALAASGLNGQRFSFHGYLPVKPEQRRQAIRRLESEAQRTGATQLFIETPYRNDALLHDLLQACQEGTRLCLAVNITQPDAFIRTRTVGEWRSAVPVLGKRPAVFVLGT